ncbi:MAG TPA: hypothetical protein VM674_03855 [Candidatus Acidoferrum sp.]|nr:hypothetical protein [Candidatus Acidoferrum sp.]
MSSLNSLVEPAFIDRRNPPVKVSAAAMGWIVAVLSVLLLVGLAATGISSVRSTQAPGHAGNFVLAGFGLVLVAIIQIVILGGAVGMIRGSQRGRRMVIASLLLSVVFSLVYNLGLANFGQFVLQFVIRAILYYFTVVSRFPDEAPA